MKSPVLTILIVLLNVGALFAQKTSSKIIIEGANEAIFDTKSNVSKFVGNCRFRHDNATMMCDSATLNDKTNVLDAYGHVKIIQADTITVTSKTLHYDGNTKKAELFDDVSLSDRKAVLTTNYLLYDMVTRVGTYPNPGKITNADNVLTSNSGNYFVGSKEAFFHGDVKIVTPQAEIKSDTLHYNTVSRIAFFFGPTRIKSKDDFIYTENGWYNTSTDQANSSKNSYYENGSKKLKGDSLFYDRKAGFGRAIKNVFFVDTTDRILLQGDYGQYTKRTEEAFVTKRAILSIVQDKDTLFLTADTLKTTMSKPDEKPSIIKPSEADSSNATIAEAEVPIEKLASDTVKNILPPVGPGITEPLKPVDKQKPVEEKVAIKNTKTDSLKIGSKDTLKKNLPDTSRHRIMFAYRNVRMFKSDFQAVADSLVYTYVDSTMRCYKHPAMWTQGSQMTADQIDLELKNKKLNRLKLVSSSFLVSRDVDSTKYNQIAGKNMVGLFTDNELSRMFVNGNAESIYYPLEDSVQKTYTGMNRSLCSKMLLTFKNNKLKTVRWDKDVEGTLHPIEKIPAGVDKLDGFNWRGEERPISKEDIFRKVAYKEPKAEAEDTNGRPLKPENNIKPATPQNSPEKKDKMPVPNKANPPMIRGKRF
ncbi:OstA-like protein [Solitalea koreensis]|uniref:OstA-like protein n=1 Tax=Solitalea koreensis TaxID=543615 RepID=A0A521ARM7_9SPHI|nr:OstA-like protein [Solitalea koreensis]SMO37457.1 OstA-like protein [Solitalea koreensis]